jgi:hypothetical protein
MSSSREPRVAQVSVKDQGTIMALIDVDKNNTGFEQLREAFAQTQEVLMRVAQYSQPIREVKMVCEHPQLIIDLQRQIPDLEMKKFIPPQCDHTVLERQLQTLRNERDEAVRRLPASGTNEDLQQELDDMTRDARQSGEEVHVLRTQLVNDLTLAAMAARAAPQAPEDRGQKFPDSPDFSWSDRTQLRGWIAQLRMVIRHMPASFTRRTVEVAVRIQQPERSRLAPDLATRPGGRNDSVGRPTSFYTTPGSSFWGPRLSSHRRTENAGS